jgi:alpha-tubulin suppressor-like RCC1 family protein
VVGFRLGEPTKRNAKITHICCGSNFATAIDTDGDLWSWGSNYYGQLGTDSPRNDKADVPHPIEGIGEPVNDISCGMFHCAIITKNFLVYSWGNNINGQLGIGQIGGYRAEPQLVEALNGEVVNAIQCGTNNTMALTELGQVFGWGNNAYYRLGFPQT